MAKWKAFAQGAEDIANALSRAGKRLNAAEAPPARDFDEVRDFVSSTLDNVTPAGAITAIKRVGNSINRMNQGQIDEISPLLRDLIGRAKQAARPYKDDAGNVIGTYSNSIEAIESVANTARRNAAFRLGQLRAMSGEPEQPIDAVMDMARKLAKSILGDKPSAVRIGDADIDDAYRASRALTTVRSSNDEAYEELTNAANLVNKKLSTAVRRRLNKATTHEELDERWRSLPEEMRKRLVDADKAGTRSPIVQTMMDKRASLGPRTAPPAPTGGGASPLAKRPSGGNRRRPATPPPPLGPDSGRPRRRPGPEMPPMPDFPMM